MTASFDVSTVFNHPVASVLAVLSDPDFHLTARKGGIVQADRIVTCEITADQLVTAVHYQFVGDLNSTARKFVSPERISWVGTVVYDLASGETEGTIAVDDPEYARMITAGSKGSLREADGTTTLRTTGTVKIHKVPLMGGVAEKWIAGTFAKQQQAFGKALARRLDGD